MSLSWKDAVATVLVGVAGIITYGRLKGFDWPLLNNWRMGSLVLLVIGLGTCIVVGSGVVPTKDAWTTTATVLGGISALFALIGIVFNSKVAFIALAIDILALWVVATIHHLMRTGA